MKKNLAKEVDLAKVAQTTAGFTGADLENLLNEAAILSARRNKKVIEQEEIELNEELKKRMILIPENGLV